MAQACRVHEEVAMTFRPKHGMGSHHWFANGERHRKHGPAIEFSSGYKSWYSNGQRYREDGPAIEWSDGSKEWWFRGQLHREDGPAVEWSNGHKVWYVNNRFFMYESLGTRIIWDGKEWMPEVHESKHYP